MTNPATSAASAHQRTTWVRRYTTDPDLADEFMDFLRTRVFPERRRRGFSIDAAWLNTEKTEFIWLVSRAGDAAEFEAAEKEWENSTERAEIFAGTPHYVVAKSLHQVTPISTTPQS